MSFFPEGYDPQGEILGALDLCEMDTPDGPMRFMIGADGVFTDVNGNKWCGTQLASVSSLESALEGRAPEGSITLSYFQDPEADDLISEVKALGVDYIKGRAIRFFFQPIGSMAELYQPKHPPKQWMQRTMRSLRFSASGAQDRSISLGFEAWTEKRRAAGRLVMNTEGHARLTGAPNPSLKFAPTTAFEEEKLFG
ncbi:hypothetical protein [Pseudophaeobacter sp. TrK17]|uniref:hypothetical protein n=1 Tax=Pseudophaeobacter sp. TrK17 TaxID=2815167 RepID=UPI0035CF606D